MLHKLHRTHSAKCNSFNRTKQICLRVSSLTCANLHQAWQTSSLNNVKMCKWFIPLCCVASYTLTIQNIVLINRFIVILFVGQKYAQRWNSVSACRLHVQCNWEIKTGRCRICGRGLNLSGQTVCLSLRQVNGKSWDLLRQMNFHYSSHKSLKSTLMDCSLINRDTQSDCQSVLIFWKLAEKLLLATPISYNRQ